MQRSSIEIDPIALNNYTASVLSALFTCYPKETSFVGSYQVKDSDNQELSVQLKYPLVKWVKSMPELGIRKARYDIQSLDSLGKGALGVVYPSLGTLKKVDGSLTFTQPQYARVIKAESLNDQYAGINGVSDSQKKEIYKRHYKYLHRESFLMFQRAKYTHAKRPQKSHSYALDAITISRRFSGGVLDNQKENKDAQDHSDRLSTMNPLERVAAALSMLKCYVSQVENNHLMHFDIKPSNFIFDFEKNRGHFIDFGFAEKSEHLIKSDAGSLLFQSFEIIRGKVKDKKADYFALGRSLQELFGDSNIDKMCYNMTSNIFVAEMTALYDRLESKKTSQSAVSVLSPREQHFHDFHEFKELFSCYDLNTFFNAQEKQDIQRVISGLLHHNHKERDDSLDRAISIFMLLYLRLLHRYLKSPSKPVNHLQVDRDRIVACQETFKTFTSLLSMSFDDVERMRDILKDGVDRLPNSQELIDFYIDFIELDNAAAIEGKEALKQYIDVTFDLYKQHHDKLIGYLQQVSRLMIARKNAKLSDSERLDTLFFNIYNQLSRKDRSACCFNEVAHLANVWPEKTKRIEDGLKVYLSSFPSELGDLTVTGQPVHFTKADRKQLKSGLSFLRSLNDESIARFLNQYRCQAAMALQNCFVIIDKQSVSFHNDIVPLANVFSMIVQCHKKTNSKLLSLLVDGLAEIATSHWVCPLIEGKSTNAKIGADLKRLFDVILTAASDNDRVQLFLSFFDDLSREVKSLTKEFINHSQFFSRYQRPTLSVPSGTSKRLSF